MLRGMLHLMQQTAPNSPSPTASSFAGLLASLTTPVPKTAWNTDELADDVATLSYEHALRTHARHKSDGSDDWAFAQADDQVTAGTKDALKEGSTAATRTATMWAAPGWGYGGDLKTAQDFSAMLERDKKCASITIRLSKGECEQLRNRASAAGLTVSAYLRSCTFEAETLRAQVKEVLAEMRTAASTDEQSAPGADKRSWFGWLMRIVPHWHPGQRVARA